MSNISVNVDNFEIVLGTPTAQKIIKILAVYLSLPVQDLVVKSNVSKSQVHATLNNLIAHNILHSPSRGIYTFQDSPFAKSLKEAYHKIIIELISKEIYTIRQLLKNTHLDEANAKFNKLIEQYQPILKEYFTPQMNSLTHDYLDRVEEARM